MRKFCFAQLPVFTHVTPWSRRTVNIHELTGARTVLTWLKMVLYIGSIGQTSLERRRVREAYGCQFIATAYLDRVYANACKTRSPGTYEANDHTGHGGELVARVSTHSFGRDAQPFS